MEIVRINKKVSNVRAKFDVWSLMYTTDTSVDSFLTAAAPLPFIQTFYSRFLTSFFFEIPLLWYWGKPASHGLRLHGNDNHFSIGFFLPTKKKNTGQNCFPTCNRGLVIVAVVTVDYCRWVARRFWVWAQWSQSLYEF